MIRRVAPWLALPLLLLAQPAAAQEDFQDPGQARWSYAVKFVCSRSNPSLEEGVLPGTYGTAINVRNPFLDRDVVYFKRFVQGFVKQQQGEPTGFQREVVLPHQALDVECLEILDRLGGPTTATGFVTFLTQRQLDITAVYTAGPRDGDVASIDVETITPRWLPALQ